MSCDVGEATERLENELCYDYNYELCSFSNISVTSPTSQLILQPFRRFTYVAALLQPFRCFIYVTVHSPMSSAHSPTFPSLLLHHNSFSNPSIALPTSQFILEPFFRFSYVTSSSLVIWRAAHDKN